MNIRDALDFCIDKAYTERAKNTARTYEKSANVFLDFLKENSIEGNQDVATLPIDLFIRYPAWLLKKYTRMTAGVYMAGAMYIWKWLLIQDWITPTLNQSVRLEKAVEMAQFNRGARHFRTPEKGDIDKMIAAVHQMSEPAPRKERDLALVLFLASSGCRNSEAVNLKIKDVGLAQRQALIKEGKGDKDRIAFFSQEAADALRAYWTARGYQGKTDPIFARHDRGSKYGAKKEAMSTATVRNVIDAVTALAGIEKGHFTPHYFRHAFAIKALEETGNLALVQDLLGHASPQTTRVYAEIYEDDLRAAHHKIFN